MAERRRRPPAGATPAAPEAQPRVLPSKLVPSAVSASQIERQALVRAMLDASAARLILVRAPAGFGKTTLMRQYRAAAVEAGRGVLWLNLDSADNDIQRFVAHLDAGFAMMEAEASEHASRTAGTVASELIDRIASHPHPFLVIFDEFEAISGAAVLNYVQQILEVLPPHGTLAIATRVLPDIGLGRFRMRGQLLEIGPAALRFSLDEATVFLREKHKLPLRDKEIATLHRCTEGWVAAIYLASLSLHSRTDHAAFVFSFSGTNRDLAQYLAEDILARQSEACRDFLLQTSVLDKLCAPLCDAVTGRDDSAAMIEYLETTNLFLFRADDDGSWFRYHALFASFLRDRLERRQPGSARALHRAAAGWYGAEGRPIPAIEHLLQAGAEEEAIAQIGENIQTLQETGRVRLLMRWFDRISYEALARHPRLELAYAWTLTLSRRYADAMRIVKRVLDSGRGELLLIAAETLRIVVLAMTDRVEECYEAGLSLIDRLPEDQTFLFENVTNSLAYSMVVTSRYDEARGVLSRAMQREARWRSTAMRSIADAIEGNIDLMQGRLGNPLARLRTAAEREWGNASGTAAGGKASILIALASALYENDDIDEAEHLLVEALPYAKGTGSHDSLINSHILTARIALLRGDRDLWARTLAELEELGLNCAATRVVCSAWLERARVATIKGRLDMAEEALHSASLNADWVRPGVSMHANDTDTPFIAGARLRIAKGDCAGLADALLAEIEQAKAVQRHRRALKLSILLALCLDRDGRQAEAFSALKEALRSASHEGFVRMFLDEGDAMRQLMLRWSARNQDESATRGIGGRFLAALLEKMRDGEPERPADGAASAEHGADVLSGRELQVLRLLAQGMRNKAIAAKLFLSELTVKSHLRNINAKLGAHGRTEAAAIARKRGLID